MQPELKGISPAVDSCAGLIAQQAYRVHNKLAKEHKRWVDPEDLMQEALLEAVQAERRYKPGKGAKYSTYLYNGLFFELRKNYVDRLRLQKRHSVSILELDAPIDPEGTSTFQVADKSVLIEAELNSERRAVYGIAQLCRAVSAPARLVIVKVLLCGKKLAINERVYLPELAEAASKIGAQWGDLAVLAENEKIRQMALNQLVSSGIVGLTETDARVLECIRCEGQFTLSDVRSKRYFVAPMTCRTCLRKLKADPASCFGKTKTGDQEGYSEADVECRLHCRANAACKEFQTKDSIMAKKNNVVEEIADVDFEEAPEPVKKASKKEAKVEAATKAKPAKAAKEPAAEQMPADEVKFWTKYDETDAPTEVGDEWPWKSGSFMRRMFQHAYHGIKKEELEKRFKSAGRKAEIFFRVLRSGKSGKGVITHTWKLNEEGGKMRPYDVKYLGKSKVAKEPKATKVAKVKAEAKAEKPAKAVAKQKKAA